MIHMEYMPVSSDPDFLRKRTGPPEVVQEVFTNLKIGNLAGVKHLTDSTSAANGRQISKSEERVGVSDR